MGRAASDRAGRGDTDGTLGPRVTTWVVRGSMTSSTSALAAGRIGRGTSGHGRAGVADDVVPDDASFDGWWSTMANDTNVTEAELETTVHFATRRSVECRKGDHFLENVGCLPTAASLQRQSVPRSTFAFMQPGPRGASQGLVAPTPRLGFAPWVQLRHTRRAGRSPARPSKPFRPHADMCNAHCTSVTYRRREQGKTREWGRGSGAPCHTTS